jgi:hypothetical protein
VDAWLLVPVALLAALMSGLTAAAVAGRGRRWLLDQPGQHRSHIQPMPRGGGLGIALVLAALGLGVSIGALDGAATRLGIALFLAFALVGALCRAGRGCLPTWLPRHWWPGSRMRTGARTRSRSAPSVRRWSP